MESEVARANWERMSPADRLVPLPEIRHMSVTYSGGEGWGGMSNEELSSLPYDELPADLQWDLYMAEDGEGFSGDAWYRSYQQMTDGKEGR